MIERAKEKINVKTWIAMNHLHNSGNQIFIPLLGGREDEGNDSSDEEWTRNDEYDEEGFSDTNFIDDNNHEMDDDEIEEERYPKEFH